MNCFLENIILPDWYSYLMDNFQSFEYLYPEDIIDDLDISSLNDTNKDETILVISKIEKFLSTQNIVETEYSPYDQVLVITTERLIFLFKHANQKKIEISLIYQLSEITQMKIEWDAWSPVFLNLTINDIQSIKFSVRFPDVIQSYIVREIAHKNIIHNLSYQNQLLVMDMESSKVQLIPFKISTTESNCKSVYGIVSRKFSVYTDEDSIYFCKGSTTEYDPLIKTAIPLAGGLFGGVIGAAVGEIISSTIPTNKNENVQLSLDTLQKSSKFQFKKQFISKFLISMRYKLVLKQRVLKEIELSVINRGGNKVFTLDLTPENAEKRFTFNLFVFYRGLIESTGKKINVAIETEIPQ